MLTPETPAQLAEAMRAASSAKATVSLGGASSKRLMAGPIEPAAIKISTCAMRRVREYEPHDLTISVEAGLLWHDLAKVLAQNRQMVPLDPPWFDNATVGGVIASNSSGPRRRLYGTARDLVIGMHFVTLEGKLVQSGGMVVKNVAGLDMAKLMIGSFGTLAAIAVVNFKVQPAPEEERSFLLSFPDLAAAMEARNRILASPLQPAAIDLLNPGASATLGKRAWMLAVRVGGNSQVVNRYERELSQHGEGVALEAARHKTLWQYIREFTPRYLAEHADGAVVRASCTLKELEAVIGAFDGPAVARAGSGVCYGHFEECEAAARWLTAFTGRGGKGVIEYSPEACKNAVDLWPAPGSDVEIMRRVKQLFDPSNLMNRGRLYRRI
ncbi:MAG TPA: FAD-binding oxidoreductase [Bryobacteraceae bacterium]